MDGVHQALERGCWTYRQKAIVLLAALTIISDGFDNQALGLAIASIAKSWDVPASAFGKAAAVGLIAMTIGTWLAGWLGDRIGRRWTLIGSVLLFGCATTISSMASGLTELIVMRFVAGLGLGGAMPIATAISAEFSPLRVRHLAVTATIVCVPLGGLLGGLVASELLPLYGWSSLFAVGGITPLVLAVLLFFWLPESPAYLARFPDRRAELAAVMARIGHSGEVQAANEERPQARASDRALLGFGALFRPEYRHSTIGLWASCFLCLIAVYTTFNWVPATLSSAGFDTRMASLALAGFNLGGIVGALLGGWVISRLGSRLVIMSLSAIGAVGGATLTLCGVSQLSPTMLLALITLLGFSVNGAQTTMFALASHIYPSEMRTTGVGAALGFGRFGAILSSFIGASIAAIGMTSGIFAVLGLAMLGTMFGMLLIRRHIAASQRTDRHSVNPIPAHERKV